MGMKSLNILAVQSIEAKGVLDNQKSDYCFSLR